MMNKLIYLLMRFSLSDKGNIQGLCKTNNIARVLLQLTVTAYCYSLLLHLTVTAYCYSLLLQLTVTAYCYSLLFAIITVFTI